MNLNYYIIELNFLKLFLIVDSFLFQFERVNKHINE